MAQYDTEHFQFMAQYRISIFGEYHIDNLWRNMMFTIYGEI